MKKTLPLFNSCIRWLPTNGKSINLWYDNWLSKTLRNKLVGPLPKTEEERKVSSIIRGNQNFGNHNFNHWNLNKLPFCLPKDLRLEILFQPLPTHNSSQEDKLIWNLTQNGSFTSKSAYLFIQNQNSQNDNNHNNIKKKS